MVDTRKRRTRNNIIVPPLCQLIRIGCGFVVPRLMIGAFGSELYGATTSIAQFLAYITLLEGGIGGVARAALYKPLADQELDTISNIVAEIKRFFRVIAYIFIGYVFVLACSFKDIANAEYLDWYSSFMLVIVISLSTFAQYFIGISYNVLMQAAQRRYVTSIMDSLTIVVNTTLVIILVRLNCGLIAVKLVSSIVFVMRPILSYMYVKKEFALPVPTKEKTQYLKNKWVGLGQHIAYFLHSNTDVMLLTIMVNLKTVAVYSVYHMVIAHIQNLASSFFSGMESLFGELLAKHEHDELHSVFGYFETLTSIITTILFSVVYALVIPFVRIYTQGIRDVNYIEPVFAYILIASAVATCLRMPYHNLVIAAGHFKQTQVAAYGEAAINVVLSAVLVHYLGLVGVAIGTLVSTVFRMLYYVLYLAGNVFNRRIGLFVKRTVTTIFIILIATVAGWKITVAMNPVNYLQWVMNAVVVGLVTTVITVGGNYAFYRNDVKGMITKFLK